MSDKPYLFRAIHTNNPWRKSSHETFERATEIGERSALALFERRNKAINYAKHGDALYVVVWHKDGKEGLILKPHPDRSRGMSRSRAVPRSKLDNWEKHRGARIEELESYFTQEPLAVQAAESTGPPTLEELHEQLHSAIARSASSPREARLRRLEKASPIPKKVDVTTSAFVRNADVIVEVLERASGHCERCGASAPFRRVKDGSPYLEVHHIVQLSNGGKDTVANAQALCPNCHRNVHFGNSP